jgi:hypothetical protein
MQEQQQMPPSFPSLLCTRPCKTMFASFTASALAVNNYERFERVEERIEGEEEEH